MSHPAYDYWCFKTRLAPSLESVLELPWPQSWQYLLTCPRLSRIDSFGRLLSISKSLQSKLKVSDALPIAIRIGPLGLQNLANLVFWGESWVSDEEWGSLRDALVDALEIVRDDYERRCLEASLGIVEDRRGR